MSWFTLQRDDEATLRGWDDGEGLPVIFQHGLGGDEAQVAEVFPDGEEFRRLTLECRGQGSSTLGDPKQLSISTFADDVLAFAGSRSVDRFVIGGISMGAAIAMRVTIKNPARVRALILARPAWLWGAAPANMKPFIDAASYLRQRTVSDFEASATAQRLAREAPDNLASLRRFFFVKDREATATLLAAIAGDGPGASEAEVRAIAVPTLVIGHKIDAVHPIEYAQTLASRIAGSQFVEIIPKATDKPKHVAEFRKAVAQFLSSISKGNTP
jgi:pimeloyl-ACP methyl ester carboxylesterase